MRETLREIIRKLPLEDRLEFVTMDEIPAEERLKGLPAEERLRGLSPDELERLRKILQQPGTRKPDDGK
jgi:hypothetical protein